MERAWALYIAGGFDQRGDPAALAVRGRLLKARARGLAKDLRAAAYGAAARAYGAADALSPAPYLAINVASLLLLAGEGEGAKAGARACLARLDAGDAQDTPYFLAATRAEALLILGKRAQAEQALAEAVAHDPTGWDDRAATIAQLAEIASHLGMDTAWLAPFRPPAVLHFAGHMGFAPRGQAAADLRAAADLIISRERIGFGYGALAAGTDIIIAEALLAAGGEINVVLPSPPEVFVLQSVAPAGADWRRRYHRLLARAASVRVSAPVATPWHDPCATALAAELAMGRALLHARRYATRAVQLVVFDERGGGVNTARLAARWPKGAAQHRSIIARSRALVAFPEERPNPGRTDAAMLHIRQDMEALGPLPDAADIAANLAPIEASLALIARERLRVGAGWCTVILDDAQAATELALAILAATRAGRHQQPSIGIARGLVTVRVCPLTGAWVAHGGVARLAERLALRSTPGLALASESLAVGLALSPAPPGRFEFYLAEDHELEEAAYLVSPA